MKYLNIKEKLSRFKIFCLEDLYMVDPGFRRATLCDWEESGYISKIRNKWYFFNDNKPANLDLYLVANKIYSPSYISLELALNHYGFIPEMVSQITSVSTLKTNSFETSLGMFDYRNLKEELFFGYRIINNEGVGIKIASPEKAILDYFYLSKDIESKDDLGELRLNLIEIKEMISYEKMINFAEVFHNNRVNYLVEILLKEVKNVDN